MVSITNRSPLNWQDRSEKLKKQIDTTFEKLSRDECPSWGLFNGDQTYNMLSISEIKCIKTAIQQAPKEQKEFYVLDIGAGDFQLVQSIAEYINKKKNLRPDIIVHVIGIRGERGLDSQESIGKCKLYRLTAFKIENLFDEFLKRGFLLENNVNFIISRWSFRHFNDPLGTFVQTYNLLRPRTGILVIDGFFSLNKNQKIEDIVDCGNDAMTDLFVRTEAPFLMEQYDYARSLNRFMLQRHHNSPCQLYMSYLDSLTGVWNAQIYSGCITRFDKGIELADITYFKFADDNRRRLYGDKKLYDWLRKNRIIELDVGWGTTANDSENRFKLHQAARDGNLREIEHCLEAGSDMNEVDFDGYTPLHLAMIGKKLDCFQFLLDKGADCITPSCDVMKIYRKYKYGGRKVKDDIDIKGLTLLWEAEKRGYDEVFISILRNMQPR